MTDEPCRTLELIIDEFLAGFNQKPDSEKPQLMRGYVEALSERERELVLRRLVSRDRNQARRNRFPGERHEDALVRYIFMRLAMTRLTGRRGGPPN